MDKEKRQCRICRCESTDAEPLYSPCRCDGSIKFIHDECLRRWLSVTKRSHCEVCNELIIYESDVKILNKQNISLQLAITILKIVKVLLYKIFSLIFLFFVSLIFIPGAIGAFASSVIITGESNYNVDYFSTSVMFHNWFFGVVIIVMSVLAVIFMIWVIKLMSRFKEPAYFFQQSQSNFLSNFDTSSLSNFQDDEQMDDYIEDDDSFYFDRASVDFSENSSVLSSSASFNSLDELVENESSSADDPRGGPFSIVYNAVAGGVSGVFHQVKSFVSREFTLINNHFTYENTNNLRLSPAESENVFFSADFIFDPLNSFGSSFLNKEIVYEVLVNVARVSLVAFVFTMVFMFIPIEFGKLTLLMSRQWLHLLKADISLKISYDLNDYTYMIAYVKNYFGRLFDNYSGVTTLDDVMMSINMYYYIVNKMSTAFFISNPCINGIFLVSVGLAQILFFLHCSHVVFKKMRIYFLAYLQASLFMLLKMIFIILVEFSLVSIVTGAVFINFFVFFVMQTKKNFDGDNGSTYLLIKFLNRYVNTTLIISSNYAVFEYLICGVFVSSFAKNCYRLVNKYMNDNFFFNLFRTDYYTLSDINDDNVFKKSLFYLVFKMVACQAADVYVFCLHLFFPYYIFLRVKKFISYRFFEQSYIENDASYYYYLFQIVFLIVLTFRKIDFSKLNKFRHVLYMNCFMFSAGLFNMKGVVFNDDYLEKLHSSSSKNELLTLQQATSDMLLPNAEIYFDPVLFVKTALFFFVASVYMVLRMAFIYCALYFVGLTFLTLLFRVDIFSAHYNLLSVQIGFVLAYMACYEVKISKKAKKIFNKAKLVFYWSYNNLFMPGVLGLILNAWIVNLQKKSINHDVVYNFVEYQLVIMALMQLVFAILEYNLDFFGGNFFSLVFTRIVYGNGVSKQQKIARLLTNKVIFCAFFFFVLPYAVLKTLLTTVFDKPFFFYSIIHHYCFFIPVMVLFVILVFYLIKGMSVIYKLQLKLLYKKSLKLKNFNTF